MTFKFWWGHKFKALNFGKNAVLGLATYVAFTDHFYDIKLVHGKSMQPTLNTSGNDTVIIMTSPWVGSLQNLERGDVITLVNPRDPSEKLIKRMIAVEGDQVTHINSDEAVDIPKGHVWVEGDNPKSSIDSRTFGAVPKGLIISKVIRVLSVGPDDLSLGPILRKEKPESVTKAEDVKKLEVINDDHIELDELLEAD